MGVCFDCLVSIDGRRNQRACLAKVKPGMRIGREAHVGPAFTPSDPVLAPTPTGELPTRDVPLLIIGAGPAGLAAAEAAAKAGVTALIVDERPEPGGQYFKQLAPSQRFARKADNQFERGRALIERVRARGIEILSETTVWGAFRPPEGAIEVGIVKDGAAQLIRPRQLIVATGAYERPYPLPGWTLPGFMTTGAAQTLGRAYRVAPGQRILIAGNGPLNIQVACELIAGGVDVVAVAEASALSFAKAGSVLGAAWRAPDLLRDGLAYLAKLKLRGVPVLNGHALIRAEGKDRIEAAVLAEVDGNGRVLHGTERRFAVDAVCAGYGFLPSAEITRLLGCRHTVGPWGGLLVERDKKGSTSVPGVFAVGDCGGLGGSRVAMSQGTLAGYAAAEALGQQMTSPMNAEIDVSTWAMSNDLKFQKALWHVFAAPTLFDEPADDTILCRCEEVTAGEIRRNLAAGATNIGTLKRVTRAGMGRCQGRYCGPQIETLCERAFGRGGDELDLFAPRFPLKPIPAAAFAFEKGEWGGHKGGDAPRLMRPLPVHNDPERRAEVIVIGAGIVGTATTYFLAKAGVDVIQLERSLPNSQASGGNAGSLHVQLLSYDFGKRSQGRKAPFQVLPLQRESARSWPALARELGRDLEIEINGGLMVAEDEAALATLRDKAAVERELGTPVEVIGPSELRSLAPFLSHRLAGAAYCPDEGKINPLLATPALLNGATKAGARFFAETEVRGIESTSNGWRLTTNRGDFLAPKVLIAAGGWSPALAGLAGFTIPAHASPLQMIVTEPAPPMVDHLVAHIDRHLSLKQARNGNLIIGGGWTATMDADRPFPKVLRSSFEGNLWVAERVLPYLKNLHIIRSWAAVNVTVDGAPLLGEIPGKPGLFIAATVNGVTLAPLLGRLLSETIRTGKAAPEIAPFSPARFLKG